MNAAELLKINKFLMEMMSKVGIKHTDWRFLEMYDEYLCMRKARDKYAYIIAVLSEKYKVSESTIKRLIKRLSREVIF